MKIFGGKLDKHSTFDKPKKQKKAKRKLTKKDIIRRLIIGAAIVAALAMGSLAAWKTWVKPPSFANDIPGQTSSDLDNLNTGESVDVEGKDRKENYFTFLVCATDEVAANTDSIMVASFDIANQTINVLNVPRDTMSNVSRKNKKINGAYYKGIENTKEELKQLLGFEVDKYIVVNFDGIAEIVDAIGGVDYNVPIKMNYDDPAQNLSIHFKPGMQHLNGKQTVNFLRFRKNNNGGGYITGDIGRVENQQKFLKTLAEKMMNPVNVVKIPKIADTVFKNVKTDFEMGQLVWLGTEGIKIKSENLQMHTLPGNPQYVNGLSYYVPSEKEILELVNQFFNPYKSDITDLDILVPSKASTESNTSKSSSTKKHTTTQKEEDLEEQESASDKAKDDPETPAKTEQKTPSDKPKAETKPATPTTPKPETKPETPAETKPEDKPKTETPPVQENIPSSNDPELE